jgi:hypothetical protein
MYNIENKMSTTKKQCREKEEETTTITSTNRELDQTKENITRRTTDEPKKDTPSYTQMIDEYHDQTFQQTRF